MEAINDNDNNGITTKMGNKGAMARVNMVDASNVLLECEILKLPLLTKDVAMDNIDQVLLECILDALGAKYMTRLQ